MYIQKVTCFLHSVWMLLHLPAVSTQMSVSAGNVCLKAGKHRSVWVHLE